MAYRDADWIATLLCRDQGKVSVLARAARRSQKRFPGVLSWFSVSDVEIKKEPNRELQVLTGATLCESYAGIATDMAAFAHGSYAIEVIRELTTSGPDDSALFDLLVSLFRSLHARGASVPVLRWFELHALGHAGFLPVFSRCVSCDNAVQGSSVLDIYRGGVLCRICAAHARAGGVRPLSEGARGLICELLEAETVERSAALEAPDDALAELRGAMAALLGHHIGKPLKTLEFVSKLKSGADTGAGTRSADHEGGQGHNGRELEHDDP